MAGGVRPAAAAGPTYDSNGPTGSSDPLRSSWYQNQPGLSPQIVGSSSFGQLFSTPVNGQVYGQPLVVNGTLLVATETNWLYGLDPETGAVQWSRQLGNPFSASEIGCADLSPYVGVTSTPTIDPATGIAYLVAKSYLSGTSGPVGYFMHAVDPATGNEEPGFPVQIQGTAQNNTQQTFQARLQMQRPGLLLLNGVVYAGFGSHCDMTPYQGWVFGVSTTGAIKARWTTIGSGTGSGGGVWQAGGGLVSDGANQILLTSGNGIGGGSPTGSIPGTTPPGNLPESVVRLGVQLDGSLKATDFFTPYDAPTLDRNDLDFGSGAPIALPTQFGTAGYPHLLFAVGKEGYVYLLNRDSLGGVGQGPGGGDGALARLGPNGGVWSSPAAWPGDGGYIYVPTANNPTTPGGGNLVAYQFGTTAQGLPSLTKAGVSAAQFGFGSGRPIVTSSGTTSGTSLVWVVRSDNGFGANSELEAYSPVPVNGVLQRVGQWPIGTAAKFSQPGVGNGRLYVGTRDGQVIGFGAPVSPVLTGTAVNFPPTVVGQTGAATATLTASAATTVSQITLSPPAFAAGAASPALPASLTAGQQLTIPLSFSPTTAGSLSGTLTAITNNGPVTLPLSGLGLTPGPNLVSQTNGLSLGGTTVNGQLSGTVTFTNLGTQSLTIGGVAPPAPPFTITGAPTAGTVIASDQSFTITVNFSPTTAGSYTSNLIVNSDGGNKNVVITASATLPSVLKISPVTIDFGSTPVGSAVTKSFTLTNVGGSPLTLDKSKPPITGPFVAATQLPEGTTLPAGSVTTETVTFVPTASGTVSDQWIMTANDGQGVQTVTFTGAGTGSGGTIPPPTTGTWQLNGSASLAGSTLQLTPALPAQAGTAFWPAALPSSNLVVSFDSTVDSGTGADGVSLILGDPTHGAVPGSLGAAGSGLGFGGVPGLAVALDEFKSPNTQAANFVGVTDGNAAGGGLHWLATANLANWLQGQTTHVVVQISANTLTAWVNGIQYLSVPVTLPPNVLLGFGGGTGSLYNRHAISNAIVVSGGLPSSPTTPIGQVYSQLGGVSGVLGPVQTAETTTPNNTGRYAIYLGGGVWEAPATGTHEVHGLIYLRYVAANTILGFLGFPLTNETPTPDGVGRYNHFQGGSIYWTPATGAHEVHGAIRLEWANLGWERSILGYPVTDETPTPDGVGRYNHFQGGSVYWTPWTGAHEVHGGIRGVWASLGWERSFLGYPVSDEYTPAPGFRRSDFEHGSITWNLATGQWSIALH